MHMHRHHLDATDAHGKFPNRFDRSSNSNSMSTSNYVKVPCRSMYKKASTRNQHVYIQRVLHMHSGRF